MRKINVEILFAANFPESVVENLPAGITTGIYYGWAQVDDGHVHKMVMSIGWNPYYDNKKKSMVGLKSCMHGFVNSVIENTSFIDM